MRAVSHASPSSAVINAPAAAFQGRSLISRYLHTHKQRSGADAVPVRIGL